MLSAGAEISTAYNHIFEWRTYPLLFPFTLCSENVMSLWLSVIPRPSASWRKSSSVVHCESKRVHRIVSDITRTWLEKRGEVQTHCKSPMYTASYWPPPPPAPPLATCTFCALFALGCAGGESDLKPGMLLRSFCASLSSVSSSSLSRFSPTTGEWAAASAGGFSSTGVSKSS